MVLSRVDLPDIFGPVRTIRRWGLPRVEMVISSGGGLRGRAG